ncbi:hypothetical protein DCCM_3544 [Desulfocucumis palustris]|uniref:Uncharacterized protein n=1 Tax=Desulfocucumis palustris TaxID=1898651 RepID=A0A2L2XJI0_9FIRM|nr:hypothetical protein DCCM_3544 [Desulfocucumis palustris]
MLVTLPLHKVFFELEINNTTSKTILQHIITVLLNVHIF